MPLIRRGSTVLVALTCAAIFRPSVVAGQDSFRSVFVPGREWSTDAVRRLAALGLAPEGHDPARRVFAQSEVARILSHAAAATDSGSAEARLASMYLARFRGEFGRRDGAMGAFSGSGVRVGFSSTDGRHTTGTGYADGHPYGDWNPGHGVPDRAHVAASALVQAGIDGWGFRASGRLGGGDFDLKEAYGSVLLGAVVVWAGRRPLDWTPGTDQGLVVNRVALDGIGFQTERPFRLPWVFSRLGSIQMDMSVARRDLQSPCVDPTYGGERVPCEDAWFLATRGSLSPHHRLTLGVSRAALFGGAGNTEVDAFAIFSILVGKHAGRVSELDNQVVSVDASYRPPTERWLPLRTYIEWGFEDSAGAFKNVPAILAGIEVPAVPGLPIVAVSIERVSFAASCCGNPIWYRHSVFHDGWTTDGRPLGHSLGGHGSEWTASVLAEPTPLAGRLVGRVFVRERGSQNLYDGVRNGRSAGGVLGWEQRLTSRFDLAGRWRYERGQDWHEHSGWIGLRGFL